MRVLPHLLAALGASPTLATLATLATLSPGPDSTGAAGTASVAGALEVNATLTELGLCATTASAMRAPPSLAEALGVNATLAFLRLWANSTGAAGTVRPATYTRPARCRGTGSGLCKHFEGWIESIASINFKLGIKTQTLSLLSFWSLLRYPYRDRLGCGGLSEST
jgi:hypothetical protein